MEATPARLPALNKIKKLDAADATHRISYALVALGTRGWPSVSTIKATGAALNARLEIPVSVASSYRQANIKVFLYTGRNEADYTKIVARNPYGVVVEDVPRFQRWRDAVNASGT